MGLSFLTVIWGCALLGCWGDWDLMVWLCFCHQNSPHPACICTRVAIYEWCSWWIWKKESLSPLQHEQSLVGLPPVQIQPKGSCRPSSARPAAHFLGLGHAASVWGLLSLHAAAVRPLGLWGLGMGALVWWRALPSSLPTLASPQYHLLPLPKTTR